MLFSPPQNYSILKYFTLKSLYFKIFIRLIFIMRFYSQEIMYSLHQKNYYPWPQQRLNYHFVLGDFCTEMFTCVVSQVKRVAGDSSYRIFDNHALKKFGITL